MKQGRTLEELGKELLRQRDARKDLIANTSQLEMHSESQFSTLSIPINGKAEEYEVGYIAQRQIASRLQIPFAYYERMRKEIPELLDRNVNDWFKHSPEQRMIRILDGNVRAFLSNRYRRLDNLELCAAVIPVIREMPGAVIESCEVTDSNLYLKVVNRKLKAEVDVGDVVEAGFVISNSEVGLGSLKVEPLIYRLVCRNGLICKDHAQKRYHVGRQVEGGDDAYELYSDETLKQDDKAFFMKVQDTVRCAVDEAKFNLIVSRMRDAKKIPLEHDPVKSVEVLADRFSLTQNERGDVLRQLFMGGDLTRYGLLNAVTAASKLADYDRATELERIGGEILALPMQDRSKTVIRIPTEKEKRIHDLALETAHHYTRA